MFLDPEAMELLNGIVTILTVFVLIIFGRYIVAEWRHWHDKWRVAGAVSIFTVFLGQFILRGTVWIQRHLENDGGGFGWEAVAPVLGVGTVILVLGSLCVVRVFSPQGTGWTWSAAALITSAAGALLVWYF